MTDHGEPTLTETESHEDRGTDTTAFLESVLIAVPAFIVRADHDLNIHYVNRYQPGLTPETVIGRSIYELVPPEDREVMRTSVERARQTGRLQSYESRGVGPNGVTAHYETFVAPVDETDGTVGVCLAAVDITRQRELEEQLRQSQKLEALGSLTAGIAHNFNNMLAVILPTLELTARLLPPERAPLLREAIHAARRATAMVQQLMTHAGQSHAAERAPHAIAQREPPLLSVPAGRCVLLVDDELAVRTTLNYVLADAGIAVLLAESGVQGLDMLSKHRDTIDVVLLDRSMPGGAGESFVPRLRAISSRARIVFLSGQPVEPALAALVDGVVPKPVTGAKLLDAIQRALVD